MCVAAECGAAQQVDAGGWEWGGQGDAEPFRCPGGTWTSLPACLAPASLRPNVHSLVSPLSWSVCPYDIMPPWRIEFPPSVL